MTQQRKVRARYKTTALGIVPVERNKASFDEETKSLQQHKVTVEQAMFLVQFPAGHSIRIDKKELKRLGYDKRPRLVDMETGDLVDAGGDPYDFGSPSDENVALVEEEETTSRRKRS